MGRGTWASYVAVVEDDVNMLGARGVGGLEKARCEERGEEALWRVSASSDGRSDSRIG